MASRGPEFNRDLDLSYIQFDPKTPLPTKPKLNTAGKEVSITLNTFPVTHFPQKPVFQYDVSRYFACEPVCQISDTNFQLDSHW